MHFRPGPFLRHVSTPGWFARRRHTSAGFTLIELMVVVLIITIMAVIALPGIARQLETRQARKSADVVASIYRNARYRALGRGAAQLVNFNAGTFRAQEAILGVNPGGAGCNTRPVTSCLATNWTVGAANNQVLETFDATGGAQLTVTMATFAAPTTYMDICFTPLGRTFVRTAAADPFVELTHVPRASVVNVNNLGLARLVVIPPNGTARVVAQ